MLLILLLNNTGIKKRGHTRSERDTSDREATRGVYCSVMGGMISKHLGRVFKRRRRGREEKRKKGKGKEKKGRE